MKAPSMAASDFDSCRGGSYLRSFSCLFVFAALALSGLVFATVAPAATKYLPAERFPPSEPDNSTWVPPSFEGLRAQSVAVSNKNGHIYVADSGRGSVFDFESTSDSSPTRWNGTNTPAGSFGGEHLSVAVDNTTGDVYVADRTHAVVTKFDEDGDLIASFGDTAPTPSGQLVGSATPDGSFSPPNGYMGTFGITVNQATHDLYVVDAHHEVVDVFDENGVYLRQITDTPTGLYREGGEYTTAIAVSAKSGAVYVGDWGGSGLVFEFGSTGDYVKTWDGSDTPDGDFTSDCAGCSPISLGVEDSTGKVFVGTQAHSAIDVFSEDNDFLTQFRSSDYPGQGLLFLIYGFAIDQATGDVYEANWSHVRVFKSVVVPEAAIDPPSAVSTTTTTFTGHVDPAGGGDVTECRFEYISDFDFRRSQSADGWDDASSVPCEASPSSSLPYPNPVDVSADISGLVVGFVYRVRLVTGNLGGGYETDAVVFETDGEYEFENFVGSPGTGDGQLAEPRDVAVDEETGAIYVADTGNHRIVKFDEGDNFVSAWGWGVDDGGSAAQICTGGCQSGLPGGGAGQFETPRYVEVDNSGGPSAHAVYVADASSGTVQKFTSDGVLVSSWGDGGEIDLGAHGEIRGLTVSSEGDLYSVGNAEKYPWTQLSYDGSFRREILTGAYFEEPTRGGIEIDDFGTFYQATPSGVAYRSPDNSQYSLRNAYPVFYTGLQSSGLALDRSENDLFVAQREYLDQFTPSDGCTFPGVNGAGTFHICPPRNTFGRGELVDAAGLAFDRTSHRLFAADLGADRLAVFRRIPLHSVTTTAATGVTPDAATLKGHVEPVAGQEIDACWFEYGTDQTFDLGKVPCVPGGTHTAGADVSVSIAGLTPLRTYHFRLAATGDNGITRFGGDISFITTSGMSPEVSEAQASVTGQSTATVAATINPMGAPTIYRLEYGADSTYGSQTMISDPIGADERDHSVSTGIAGLDPGATYHVRVVAFNINGRTAGPDYAFDMPNRPVIVDSGVSEITQSRADFSATIRAGFRPTTYRVEYGPTAAYGSSIAGGIGAGNDPRALVGTASDLTPGTTYHFRVTATNAIGDAATIDRTFTTFQAKAAPPPKRCKRGFVRRRGKCVKRRRKAANHGNKRKRGQRKGSQSHG